MARKPTAVAVEDVAELEATAAEAELSPIARIRKNNVPQLAPQDIQPEGAKWGRWAVIAQAEHTIEDALHPRYLYAKNDQIRPLDYIEIKHPFGHWCVCLDVVRVDTQARGIVAYIRHVFDFTKAERIVAPDLSEARVEYLGDRLWSVVDSHHVVKDQFPTRNAADAWLSDLRRSR